MFSAEDGGQAYVGFRLSVGCLTAMASASGNFRFNSEVLKNGSITSVHLRLTL